jgi:hypothetical protein
MNHEQPPITTRLYCGLYVNELMRHLEDLPLNAYADE